MKLKRINKTIKKITRSAFVLVLAVLFAVNPLFSELCCAATTECIKWTRVNSVAELYSAVFKCDNGTYDTSQKSDNSNHEWKPFLLVSGDCYMTNDGKKVRVNGTSGMDFDKDSFTSRGFYNTPFIKKGPGNEYYWANRSGSGVSDTGIGCNMTFWGIKYNAACRSDIRSYNIADDESSAYKNGKLATNCTMETDLTAFDSSNNTIGFKWYTSKGSTCARYFQSDFDFSKGSCGGYKIYIGEQGEGAVQTVNTQIQPYLSTKLSDATIENGVETIVGEGSTLILDGACFNCGHILVDGGTLVIRGYLDADYGGTAGSTLSGSFNPSDITIKNGGRLIIEKNGVLLHRNSSSSVTVTGNSSVYVEGTMCVSHNFTLDDGCTLRALPGSFIGLGIVPLSTTAAKSYNPASIASNKSSSLSSVATNSDGGTVKIGNNASFISYGAVYRGSNTTLTKGNCFFSAYVSTNIDASFNNMMWKW